MKTQHKDQSVTMSSVQQNSGDLIEFNSAENVDVLDKPNGGIVQQIVMGETESATLIATAVAKLTSSSVTVKPITSIPAKSESDPNVLDAVPVAAALAPTPQPPSSAIARNPNRPAVDVAFVAAAATQIDISSDSSQSSQVIILLISIAITSAHTRSFRTSYLVFFFSFPFAFSIFTQTILLWHYGRKYTIRACFRKRMRIQTRPIYLMTFTQLLT